MNETELDIFNKGLRLNIASISDVHLGHNSTPTAHIIRNLKMWVLPFNEETAKLDIIFICGDFFDRLLDALSPDLRLIRSYVVELIYFCKKHGIKLRVLRGTKLHDWDQSYLFVEENENHSIGCDLLYVDQVHIEYMEDKGIHVLYIPDEVNPLDASKTWDMVVALMAKMGIEKVDYACMHGAFPHQLPDWPELRPTMHDSDKYLSIVRHYIFIGHIHQHTIFKRIVSHGSTDRLVHGEEEKKGHVRVNNGKVKFIENKGAMRYITCKVDDLDAGQVIDKVMSILKDDDTACRVRLFCSKDSVAYGMQRRLPLRFPFVKFTFEQPKVKKEKLELSLKDVKGQLQQLPKLTMDNIGDAVDEELKAYPEYAENCSKIIRKLISGLRA